MTDKEWQTYVLNRLDTIDGRILKLTEEVSAIRTKSALLGGLLGASFIAVINWVLKFWRV